MEGEANRADEVIAIDIKVQLNGSAEAAGGDGHFDFLKGVG